MAIKQLYYSAEDEPVVEAAKRVAKLHNKSFSRLTIEALEAHVPKVAAEPLPERPRWDEIVPEPQPAKG